MQLRTSITIGAFMIITGCADDTSIAEIQGRALMGVWENGNTDNLKSVISKDAVYLVPHQSHSFEGFDEFASYVGHVKTFAGDLKVEIISTKSTNSSSAIEWKMTGIQNRPIQGRVPIVTNRVFELDGVTLIEIKDGLISKATDYMDILGFVVQLGARVELPGGIILE